MRICFITTKLNFVTSGASVEELDLKVREFMARGHEVVVVTMSPSLNVIPSPPPYCVVEESVGSGRQLALQSNVYRVLKKFQKDTDIFYIDGQVFMYGAGLYRLLGGTRPVCAHFNREQICWPENVSSFFGVPKKGILRRVKEFVRFYIEKLYGISLANRMDAVSFTNPHLLKNYQDFGLRIRDPIIAGDAFDYTNFMLKYGVTEQAYRARNKEVPPFTIYYSSRMAPGKGFDVLIAAFAKLKSKSDYRLVLGGKGEEDDKIKSLVHELGLDAYVAYTGWAPKQEHYERLRDVTDIFVQPAQSGMDKTSYILLEAMAFGIPSVLPQGGGLAWDAKESALYFRGGNADDLAKKIEELGASRELRARLSAKAYERLHEQEMDYRYQVGVWEARMRQLLETK